MPLGEKITGAYLVVDDVLKLWCSLLSGMGPDMPVTLNID